MRNKYLRNLWTIILVLACCSVAAAQLGALAYQKFLHGQTTDALALDANYVRRSDAELFWNDHASAVKG